MNCEAIIRFSHDAADKGPDQLYIVITQLIFAIVIADVKSQFSENGTQAMKARHTHRFKGLL